MKKKILFAIGSFLFGFLIIEMVLSMMGYQKNVILHRPSPYPNIAKEYIPGKKTVIDGILYQINTHGLRDFEYPMEKEEGSIRILGLGDSITFGQGVPMEETYLKRIEKELNHRSTHPGTERSNQKVQVINAGHSGFNSLQEAAYLKRRGWSYQPDLIFLGYTMNDPEDYIKTLKQILPFATKFKEKMYENSRFMTFLSHSIFKLRRTWNLKRGKGKGPATFDIKQYTLDLHDPEKKFWPNVVTGFEHLEIEAGTHSIRIIVIIWPLLFDLKNYPFRHIHEQVKDLAQQHDFDVIDLLPVFEGKDTKSLWASQKNSHPNREAHLLAADHIIGELEKKGLLDFTNRKK